MKRMFLFLTALSLIILSVCNIAIYKKRNAGFLVTPASRKTIYGVSDNLSITGFDIPERGVVGLELSPKTNCKKWKITPDSGDAYFVEKRRPEIKVLEKHHRYNVAPVDCGNAIDEITIEFDYFPASYYEGHDYTPSDIYQSLKASIPVGRYKTYSLKEWGGFNENDPEIAEARKIISKLTISKASDTKEKIRIIGKFLLDKLDRKRGVATEDMNASSPLQMYRKANGVSCFHLGRVYHLFANAAGVTTRLVDSTGKLDDVILGGHTFDESYLPEFKKWAVVDLGFNRLYVENEQGIPLSTIELFQAKRNGSHAGLKAVVYEKGEILSVDFSTMNDHGWGLFFNENATFVYYRIYMKDLASKIQTYLFKPRLAYSENSVENKHLIKLAVFYGWLASAAAFLFALVLIIFCRRRPSSTLRGRQAATEVAGNE